MSITVDQIEDAMCRHQVRIVNQQLKCACGAVLWTSDGFTAGPLIMRYGLTGEEVARTHHHAEVLLALLPGRPESVVKAEALEEAAAEYGPAQITYMGSAVGYVKAWLSTRSSALRSEQS